MIGCVADVSPRQGNLELFYLRMLLRHVRGATSFDNLRTVDGILKDTFEEACAALHLLSHTDEYDLCLTEAALLKHPRQMRRLFGLIICILEDETIGQVPDLWKKHRKSLIEDFLRRGLNRREAAIAAIEEIDAVLRRNRPELNCHVLGISEDVDVEADNENEAEFEEGGREGEPMEEGDEFDDYMHRQQYDPRRLNVEQKRIFLRILQAVSRTTGKILPVDLYDDLGNDVTADEITTRRFGNEHMFFLDGPGGTGKTFLFNTLIRFVSETLGIRVASVAWTGIAACLLIGGKTVHRTFKLPLTLRENTTVGWPVEHQESEILRDVGLLIWDEAPMTHRYAVEAVDRYLREITEVRGIPFGGKCMVFGGDFRQMLPVIPRGHRASIIDASLQTLSLWGELSKLRLTTNVRAVRQAAAQTEAVAVHRTGTDEVQRRRRLHAQLGNRTFEEWLLALGEGRLPYVVFEGLTSVPADVIEVPNIFHSPSIESLLSFVYPNGYLGEDIGEKAILCPTNAMVESVNDVILEILEGESKTYVSIDEMKRHEDDELRIPQDVINSVNVAGLPPHELTLKVGAIVMLLRNLDVENGECNGTRMKVTKLGDHLIECQLVTGENRGRKVWLPKIRMIARDSMLPQEMLRTQFPIRLAYAMTINKSQGQTLSKVGIYLQRPCFAHGQLYVAFSRVGSPDNVRVHIEDGSKQGSFKHRTGKKFTSNVVYHTLLRYNTAMDDLDNHPSRQIISRDEVTSQANLHAEFSEDAHAEEFFEQLNVSQLIRDAEDDDAALAALNAESEDEAGESSYDPYVDATGRDQAVEFAPPRNRAQLAARVSTLERPGTSGLALIRPPPPRRPPSSSDSD